MFRRGPFDDVRKSDQTTIFNSPFFLPHAHDRSKASSAPRLSRSSNNNNHNNITHHRRRRRRCSGRGGDETYSPPSPPARRPRPTRRTRCSMRTLGQLKTCFRRRRCFVRIGERFYDRKRRRRPIVRKITSHRHVFVCERVWLVIFFSFYRFRNAYRFFFFYM